MLGPASWEGSDTGKAEETRDLLCRICVLCDRADGASSANDCEGSYIARDEPYVNRGDSSVVNSCYLLTPTREYSVAIHDLSCDPHTHY